MKTTGNKKALHADFYYLKGTVDAVLKAIGVIPDSMEVMQVPKLDNHIVYKLNNQIIAGAGEVKKSILDKFGIKQPVFFAGLNWALLSELASGQTKTVKEIPKYPAVQRDVAMIVPKELAWEEVQQTVAKDKTE